MPRKGRNPENDYMGLWRCGNKPAGDQIKIVI